MSRTLLSAPFALSVCLFSWLTQSVTSLSKKTSTCRTKTASLLCRPLKETSVVACRTRLKTFSSLESPRSALFAHFHRLYVPQVGCLLYTLKNQLYTANQRAQLPRKETWCPIVNILRHALPCAEFIELSGLLTFLCRQQNFRLSGCRQQQCPEDCPLNGQQTMQPEQPNAGPLKNW
jgi:hypothetical protein